MKEKDKVTNEENVKSMESESLATSKQKSAPEEVDEYWSRERMEEARPLSIEQEEEEGKISKGKE